MTINVLACVRSVALLAATLVTGCAPAYHSYSGCYVDCTYCLPPPLPLTGYEEDVCHADVVSRYLTAQPPSEGEPTEAGAIGPNETEPNDE